MWEIIRGILILVSAFVSPLDLAFSYEGVSNVVVQTSNNIALACFYLDVFFSFRTTYYNSQNEEIINFKLISLHYIASHTFWFDMVSILPISEIASIMAPSTSSSYSSSTGFVKYFKALKLFRILRLFKLQQ